MKKYIKKLLFRIFGNKIFIKSRNIQTNEHKLNYLFWECTLRCNLKCLHCGSDCLSVANSNDMPKEDFIKILDELKGFNFNQDIFICITGGEPLLRNDLEEVGIEIRKRGYKWGIVTNGLALTKERFYSLINSGLSSLSVSLDGLYEQHTYMRQNPLSFQKTVESFDFINDYSKQNSKFIYDVITCVHNANFDILPQLRDFLISKNVKRWRIFSVWPEGRAEKNQLKLDFKNYLKLLDFIVQTNSSQKIKCEYSCDGYLGKYENKVRSHYYFCIAGIHVASIMCNGDVTGCLSIRNKDFIQGNIYKDSFIDVWNNKFGNMRDRSWAKIGKCKNCKKWNLCLGNGIHLHSDAHSEPCRCQYEIIKNYALN